MGEDVQRDEGGVEGGVEGLRDCTVEVETREQAARLNPYVMGDARYAVWLAGFIASSQVELLARTREAIRTLDSVERPPPVERLVTRIRLDTNVGAGSAAGVGHDRIHVWSRGFPAGELTVAAGDGEKLRDRLTYLPARQAFRKIGELVDSLAKRLEEWREMGPLSSAQELEDILAGLCDANAVACQAARALEVQ